MVIDAFLLAYLMLFNIFVYGSWICKFLWIYLEIGTCWFRISVH